MLENRPWTASYSPGVPEHVDVPDATLDTLVADAAARWPDRTAVDFLGSSTTFAELAEQVRRGAEVLAGLGVGPGTRVSLVVPNCTSHVVAFYAVLACGGVAVEHNPLYTTEELHDQLELVGSSVVLAWRNRVADVRRAAEGTAVRHVISVDLADDLPAAKRLALRLPVPTARRTRAALTGGDEAGAPRWTTLLRAVPAGAARGAHASSGTAEDPAVILFTGGTTGVPKGAVLTHRNLQANVEQGRLWASLGAGTEVVPGMLPFFHAFGMIFCLVLPAKIGATLVAFPTFDPALVVAAHRRLPSTFVPGVAPMFPRILKAAQQSRRPVDLTSVRLGFSGAMPLTAEVADAWEDATGGLLVEGYGMTESGPIVLGNPCSPLRRHGALGIPFPDTDIKVVPVPEDEDAEPAGGPEGEVPDGAAGAGAQAAPGGPRVRGELFVRGPQIFAGYVDAPQETAAVLDADGWLRTGDVVEVDEEGFAVLADRVKELIVVGGFKVFPSVVEDHLRGLAGVEDVAVVGVPRDGTADETVLAMFVLAEGVRPPTLEEVREFAARRLPRYALPRLVGVTDVLPRSMIGKVVRRAVRSDYLAAQGGDGAPGASAAPEASAAPSGSDGRPAA